MGSTEIERDLKALQEFNATQLNKVLAEADKHFSWISQYAADSFQLLSRELDQCESIARPPNKDSRQQRQPPSSQPERPPSPSSLQRADDIPTISDDQLASVTQKTQTKITRSSRMKTRKQAVPITKGPKPRAQIIKTKRNLRTRTDRNIESTDKDNVDNAVRSEHDQTLEHAIDAKTNNLTSGQKIVKRPANEKSLSPRRSKRRQVEKPNDVSCAPTNTQNGKSGPQSSSTRRRSTPFYSPDSRLASEAFEDSKLEASNEASISREDSEDGSLSPEQSNRSSSSDTPMLKSHTTADTDLKSSTQSVGFEKRSPSVSGAEKSHSTSPSQREGDVNQRKSRRRQEQENANSNVAIAEHRGTEGANHIAGENRRVTRKRGQRRSSASVYSAAIDSPCGSDESEERESTNSEISDDEETPVIQRKRKHPAAPSEQDLHASEESKDNKRGPSSNLDSSPEISQKVIEPETRDSCSPSLTKKAKYLPRVEGKNKTPSKIEEAVRTQRGSGHHNDNKGDRIESQQVESGNPKKATDEGLPFLAPEPTQSPDDVETVEAREMTSRSVREDEINHTTEVAPSSASNTISKDLLRGEDVKTASAAVEAKISSPPQSPECHGKNQTCSLNSKDQPSTGTDRADAVSMRPSIPPRRFNVDKDGKINVKSIGLLSEMAPSSSVNNLRGPAIPNNSVGSRLFKPSQGVYSAANPSSLARGVVGNKSFSSRRDGVVQHTLGARAPLQAATMPVSETHGASHAFEAQDSLERNVTRTDAYINNSIKLGGFVEPQHFQKSGHDHETSRSHGAPSSTQQLDGTDRNVMHHGNSRKPEISDVAERAPVNSGMTSADGKDNRFKSKPHPFPAHVADKNSEAMDLPVSQQQIAFKSTRYLDSEGEPKTAPLKLQKRPRVARSNAKSALRSRIESVRANKSGSSINSATLASASAIGRSSNGNSTLDSLAGEGIFAPSSLMTTSYVPPPLIPSMSHATQEKSSFEASRLVSSAKPDDMKKKKVSFGEMPVSSKAQKDSVAKQEPRRESDLVQKSPPRPERKLPTLEEEILPLQKEKVSKVSSDVEYMNNTSAYKTLPSPEQSGDARSSEESDGEKMSSRRESDADVDRANSSTEEQHNTAAPSTLSNIVSTVTSFLPTASSIFGAATIVSKESEAELIQKRQKEDQERREAEIAARREAQRIAKQQEAEEKKERAEKRRRMLEHAERVKEEKRQAKERSRLQKKREDEMLRRKQKEEEDRKKEERRQRVAEKKRALEKEAEARKQRVLGERGGAAGGKGKVGSSRGGGNSGKEAKRDEFTSYEMTVRKRPSLTSDDDSCNSPKKRIPAWAQKRNVMAQAKEQADAEEGDLIFRRPQSINLEDAFASTKTRKRRYRNRTSSAAWTHDRLTSREEMEFKHTARIESEFVEKGGYLQ